MTKKYLKHIQIIFSILGLIQLASILTIIFFMNRQAALNTDIMARMPIAQTLNKLQNCGYTSENIAVNYRAKKITAEDAVAKMHEVLEDSKQTYSDLMALLEQQGLLQEEKGDLETAYKDWYEKIEYLSDNMLANNRDVITSVYEKFVFTPVQNFRDCSVVIEESLNLYNISLEKQNLRNIEILKDITYRTCAFAIISIIIGFFLLRNRTFQLKQEQDILLNQTKENSKLSVTDNLTGLWNRRYAEATINEAIEHKINGELLLFDLDNFKQVNDQYGHLNGDDVLRTFAAILTICSRDVDIACRTGGDEFLVYLNGADDYESENIAKRIISYAEETFSQIEYAKNVTTSIGIAGTRGVNNFEELFERADQALYVRKNKGKNGFQHYSELTEEQKLEAHNAEPRVEEPLKIKSNGTKDNIQKK